MAETDTTAGRPLDEVMLAMDVVDTLRHRQILVERELHADDRDKKLIERLREIYRSQGIEVNDRVLAEGVTALEEERFVYKLPAASLQIRLARIYVNRGYWIKRSGVALGVLLAGWLGYQFVVVGPEQRRLEQQTENLNTQIREAGAELGALQQDIDRLDQALPQAAHGSSPSLVEVVEAQRGAADDLLSEAGSLLVSARELEQLADLDVDDNKARVATVESRLDRQRDLISRAVRNVDNVERTLVTITSLKGLPATLQSERDAILAEARVEAVTEQAKRQYDGGMAALRGGDADTATAAARALIAVRKQLQQEYDILVISRADERSGVWRIPESNPSARNYYLIVEAVAADGKLMTVPVENEEDTKFYRVSKWGLRVSETLYQSVAADKQDDGIIQERRIGVKRRGYLDPEYKAAVAGGAITSW
jgi:DNA repair exonuclease SbcCD ATPase subunit